MKTLLTLSTFFLTVYSLDQSFIDDFVEKIQDIGQACAEEVHASADDIAELVSRQLPPSTQEGKCMLFCIQKGLKMMKADGGMNRAGAIAALQPLQKEDPKLYQKVLKVFITCGMKVKPQPDPCQTATDLIVCGQAEAAAVGIDEELLG